MIIGSMKDVHLTQARDTYLFDCKVAGFDPQAVNVYDHVLSSFITFTGDIWVRQLTSEHVRLYMVNLSDGPTEGDDYNHWVMSQYAMIHTWIYWMYSQKLILERRSGFKPPRLTTLFPLQFTRSVTYCG